MIFKKSEPFWQNNFAYQNRVCKVEGLSNSDYTPRISEYPFSEPCALIDAGIADLIILLNESGFKTDYCCSGLESDHNDKYTSCSHAYISCLPGKLKILRTFLPEEMDFDHDVESYDERSSIRLKNKFRYTVSEEKLKLIWEQFHKNLISGLIKINA